jgi:probable HAF family extracellular repeat protein
MALVEDTNLRGRLPVVVAIVLTTLATAMAGASAAGSSPSSSFPGFLLDRGRYTTFDAPEAVFATLPYGINDRGQIVGRYDDASSEQAFLRDKAGGFTNIRIRGARSAWAVNINNHGYIVGIYSENTPFVKAPGGKRHGFLLARGKLTRIDVPGAVETGASGINDRGQVVGAYVDAEGKFHGYLWERGRFTTIDVPGVPQTIAYDINDRGQIVGFCGDDPDDPTGATGVHGFLLGRGDFTMFDAPGVPFTEPTGINDRGQIVGSTYSDPALTELHGFLLAKGVEGPFTSIDFRGAPRTVAFDINNRGQIIGAYENPDAPPDDQQSPMRMPMMMSGL